MSGVFRYCENVAALTFVGGVAGFLINHFFGARLSWPTTAALVLAWIGLQRFIASGYRLPWFLRGSSPYKGKGRGKVAIVTGANTGIGFETAVGLAESGATVVVTCRSKEKGAATVKAVLERLPAAQRRDAVVKSLELELTDFASVERFVADFRALRLPLHILVNNAGAALPLTKEGDFATMEDGTLEATVGSNFVAPYYLTELVMPELRETQGRVVIVASRGSEAEKTSEARKRLRAAPKFEGYKREGMQVFLHYCLSKLGNVYHATHGAELYGPIGITFASLHPGGVLSDIWRTVPLVSSPGIAGGLVRAFLSLIAKTSAEGAATSLMLALSPKIDNGYFYADERLLPMIPVQADTILRHEMIQYAKQAIEESRRRRQQAGGAAAAGPSS